MSSTDYLIFVIVIILIIALPVKMDQEALSRSEEVKLQYKEILNNAVEDASYYLLKSKDSISGEIISKGNSINFKTSNLNLNEALCRFYQTLYLNLNLDKDKIGQVIIKDKIPIKMAVGYDGYYINTWVEEIDNSGKLQRKEKWMNKKNYTMFDKNNNIEIDFTLDDYMYILDKNTNQKKEGRREELARIYPNSFFSNIKGFNDIRNQVITSLIQKDLEYYTEANNSIAKRNGWNYQFKIPYIGSKAIDSIGFIAFFQGLPIGSNKEFNTYSYSKTIVIKHSKIYGYEVNGVKYYNKVKIDGRSGVIFDSEEEAAAKGYKPDNKYYKY